MDAVGSRAAELRALAALLRARIVEASCRAELPHLGSCLSCVDILVALYWGVLRVDPTKPQEPGRDHFILSKGHAAPALFQVLGMRGFLPPGWLDTAGEEGSLLGEHPPAHGVPGIEAATGSLGHGLPVAVGMALGARLLGLPSRTFVLLGDGECNEGSVWEAAMAASAQHLDGLTAVIDVNGWQATGRSREILALEPLAEKWRAFGWDAVELDGHDPAALLERLERPPDGSGRPRVLVAHTTKGKGVSFMEDDNNWHYRIPTPDEVRRARAELGVS